MEIWVISIAAGDAKLPIKRSPRGKRYQAVMIAEGV
jgi:hypothetical protein